MHYERNSSSLLACTECSQEKKDLNNDDEKSDASLYQWIRAHTDRSGLWISHRQDPVSDKRKGCGIYCEVTETYLLCPSC